MADSDFASKTNIRIKTRRLIRCPSANQISNADIDTALDNFALNKFPAWILSEALEHMFTFYTTANQDTYETSAVPTSEFYNFKNIYTNVSSPVYIAGIRSELMQSVGDFYLQHPNSVVKTSIGTGNGVLTNFTGTIKNNPLLQGKLFITTTDINGDRLLATDSDGVFTGDVSVPGSINYLTGAYDVTFDVAPASSTSIWVQYVHYRTNKPLTVLYTENKFILRPIPDIAYKIEIMTQKRPTELLLDTSLPELSAWADFWCYGTAIDILRERHDYETVEQLMPILQEERALLLSRDAVQGSTKRVPTIFNSGTGYKDTDKFW